MKSFIFIFALTLFNNAHAQLSYQCQFSSGAGQGYVHLIKDVILEGDHFKYYYYVGQEDFNTLNTYRKKCQQLLNSLNSISSEAEIFQWNFYTCDHFSDVERLTFKVSLEDQELLFIPQSGHSFKTPIYRYGETDNCDSY